MINDNIIAKNLQSAQLDILKELDRVCKELNIIYELAFGTSLGAKRHGGFIPWDDDIDVYMKIEDLELLQSRKTLFREPYFLQFSGSDPQYGMMISRLRNSNTTLIEKGMFDRDINHGIFIDIYPLFNSPQKGFKARKLVFISMIYRLMLYNKAPKNRGIIMKVGSFLLLKITPKCLKTILIKYCYSIMRNTESTGYVSSLYGDEANIVYKSSCFFPPRITKFCGLEVPVQADQDEYLRMTFGDYMKLPPEEKRVFHHDFEYIDFDKSYLEYKGKYYCINE